MMISVDSKSFVNSVAWTSKSLDQKDAKAFILFEVDEDGNGYLSHQNSFSYMRAPFTVTSKNEDEEVKKTLNGQYLSRLQAAISQSQGDISIEISDKKFIVKSSTGRFTVPTVSARVPAKPEVAILGEISDAEYFDAIQRLSKICDVANEDAVPALGVVDLKLSEDKVTIMATDRWALGEIFVDFTPNDAALETEIFGKNILIPHENASIISPTKGSSDLIEIVYNSQSDQFGYRFVDGREALFSLKDARPIPYQKIKSHKEGATNRAVMKVSELTKAISIMNGLVWDEDTSHWNLSENGLTIHDASKSNKLEVEFSEYEIEEESTLVFMREVILESFSPISTNYVLVQWKDSKTPITLTPVLDDGSTIDGTEEGPVFSMAMTHNASS